MKRTNDRVCGLRGATLALAGVFALAGTHAWATRDFERYDVILQTMPFGDTSAADTAAAAAAAAIPPSQSFVRNLRLVALREGGAGLRVGFIDIAAKPPRNYLLYVGDSSDDGIEVVDADFEGGKALLRKGADEQWIELGGAPAAAPAAASGRPSPLSRPSTATSASSSPANSYVSRLRARQEALRTRTVEPPKLSGEALQKHLQDYNVQLIKEGKPPLPIALTPEQDSQLVQEGYLPPQEGVPAAEGTAPGANP